MTADFASSGRVRSIITWLAAILLLLSPSIYLVGHFAKMPNLGWVNDDTVNWTTAKSLAEGTGYRQPGLPGEPAQTKYPPLYALVLSVAWRLRPDFPANLPIAEALNWLMFAAFGIAVERYLAAAGVGRESRFLLCVLLLFNSSILDLAYTLWPDALFVAFALCALMVIEKQDSGKRLATGNGGVLAPLGAGCLAALAFLTKGAALPLLLACPLVLACQKRWKAALCFTAGWVPWLACWFTWVAWHRTAGNDIETIYYTNYFKLFLATTPLSALKVIVPTNVMTYVSSVGKIFMVGSWYSFAGMIASEAVLLFCVVGLVGAVKQGRLVISTVFALGVTAMVVVWHAAPAERYVLPAVPVLMAGAGLQLDGLVRRRGVWGRAGTLAAAALAGTILVQGMLTRSRVFEEFWNTETASRASAFRWMAANLPKDARVLTQKEGLLYLNTGLHACRLELSPTHLIYSTDEAQRMYVVRHLEEYLSFYRLNYIFEHDSDAYLAMSPEEESEVFRAFRGNPHFVAVYRDRVNTVYKVDLERLSPPAPGETFIPPKGTRF